jgi:hypothetical protein
MSDLDKLRGLKNLVRDAVENGATAIEQVHLATARRPFLVLEQIPGIAEPARGVQQVHDAVVATSYGAVRAVTRAVSQAADLALDAIEQRRGGGGGGRGPGGSSSVDPAP